MVAVMWDDEVWLPPNITWEYFDHDDRCLTALHHICVNSKINDKVVVFCTEALVSTCQSA